MKFEEILKKISSKLKAITHRLDGRGSFFNDEDLYQEAVLYLWEKWQKKELQDKTDSYILQGCYFYLKNYLRKVCSKTDILSMNFQEPFNEDTMEPEEMFSSEKAEKNFNHIDEDLLKEDVKKNLTERERKIFELSLEDFTTREIGKKLHISHVMVVKIRKKIKDKCKELKEELILR